MFKANVGYSTNPNSFESGAETIRKALNGLENPRIAIVFSSQEYNQNELINGIRSVSNVPVIGCTSSEGIITNDGIISAPDGQSGAMVFDDPDMRVGCAILANDGDPRAIGRKLAIEAIKNSNCSLRPSYVCLIATPGEEENYLKGVQDVIGRVPVFGGCAADDQFEGQWKLFLNDTVITDGCAIMLIYNKKGVNSVFESTYKETGISGIITRVSDDRIINEIDGKKAVSKYSEWTGISEDKIKGLKLLDAGVIYPFSIKDPIGSVTLIRQPILADNDGSMVMSNKVVPGTAVNLMVSNPEELVESVETTLDRLNEKAKNEIAAYLFFHCGKRKYLIDSRINEVYNAIDNKTNDKPFLGAFTFGEFGFNDHSANSCGSLMLSFVSIEK